MLDTHEPVLAYNRIEINRRKTRWLMASFAVALLPVLSACVVWVMPWVSMIGVAIAHAMFGPALDHRIRAMQVEMDASRPAEGPVGLMDLPVSALMVMGGLLLAALVIVLLVFSGFMALLISRYGSRMVLRMAHARPIDRAEEPDLFRVVENLCIGAGLPVPGVHLVESPAPNAFATGRDPQHAALVVTRGLLTLLDRRELEGVVAHELSHIGNHDIRLTTTLAALVTMASLPFRMLEGLFRAAFRTHWLAGAIVSWMAFLFVLPIVHVFAALVSLSDEDISRVMPPFMWWWTLHALAGPAYALFVAPVVALLIRQAVSRQREFLADADAALLTRDPEGLALALVKIGAARGQRLRVGEGSVHLYFVDPADETGSLLHTLFPSHPPLGERIELLARMGSGIAPSALEAAIEAVATIPQAEPQSVEVPAAVPTTPPELAHSPTENEDADRLIENASAARPVREYSWTPLYEKPDGWSRVLAQLPLDTPVNVTGTEGNFIRVTTAHNLSGYVSSASPLAAQHVHRSIPNR